MQDARVNQVAGACAVVGGLSWTAASIVHASQPRGCVAEECAVAPMRNATTGTTLLVALAALMMLACGASLLSLIRRRGGLGWTGVVGGIACGLGIAVLAVASSVQELIYDGDLPSMPGFVVPAASALAVGLALVGWTVLRSRIVPTWTSLSLLAGALLLLGANEQTSAILLAVPFGLAWCATGVTLILRRQAQSLSAERTRLELT